MDLWPSSGEILVRLVLAVVLGGILGLEREWKRKPAGLRTHTLVCLGAAAFTLIGLDLFSQVEATGARAGVVDVTRVLQGIIGGIGFVGAGSIIQSRGRVEGLTTAGSLWFVGAIGVATGGGHYLVAGASVSIGLAVLLGLGFLEEKFESRGDDPDD